MQNRGHIITAEDTQANALLSATDVVKTLWYKRWLTGKVSHHAFLQSLSASSRMHLAA